MEFGICIDFNFEMGEFVYVIGMEVKEGILVFKGIVYRSFFELDYVVFIILKLNEEFFIFFIQFIWNYVFIEWFFELGYEYYGLMEFELYDKRCYGLENKEIDIYIFVKKQIVKV